ncbi:hypothetical protein [Cupriavidus metallidurans]|uniref:hypothetical protein n=1 Tax=Cupriavidus metallidurans TaxID=119219 RepID=UPI001268E3E5|nr:hypothetical protein [Cupriavidus metallidurans]
MVTFWFDSSRHHPQIENIKPVRRSTWRALSANADGLRQSNVARAAPEPTNYTGNIAQLATTRQHAFAQGVTPNGVHKFVHVMPAFFGGRAHSSEPHERQPRHAPIFIRVNADADAIMLRRNNSGLLTIMPKAQKQKARAV